MFNVGRGKFSFSSMAHLVKRQSIMHLNTHYWISKSEQFIVNSSCYNEC